MVALLLCFFRQFSKSDAKPKFPFMKSSGFSRAIHACQIEHEVRLTAVLVQLRRGGIQIVLVDFFNVQCRAGFVLAVPNVFQVITQGRFPPFP